MRSFKNRLALLERAHHLERETPLWQRSYYLPHTVYGRVLVGAFRDGDLIVEDGRIVVDTNPARSGAWRCDWIAAARELLELGWIGFGYAYTEVPPRHRPPSWKVMLGHAATYELYSTDKDRYFAVHATGRTFDPAIRVAAWRAGTPITTVEQVAA
jgi:hypothetical protein